MAGWDYRYFWILTTTTPGNLMPYGDGVELPVDTKEYTPRSGQIKDVNFPPQDLGQPICISLVDREHQTPRINIKIPPGAEPVYWRYRLTGHNLRGHVVADTIWAHVIGYAIGTRRIQIAVSDKDGTIYGFWIDDKRSKGAPA